jgi:hypothetical protein
MLGSDTPEPLAPPRSSLAEGGNDDIELGPIETGQGPEQHSSAAGDEPEPSISAASIVTASRSAATNAEGSRSDHDIEALSVRLGYVNSLQVSSSSKAHAIAAEFGAKFVASAMHFGLARQYAEFGLGRLLTHLAPNHPAAAAILDNPRGLAAVTALVAAPALASSHYLGEVHVRPLILKTLGARVTATSPEDALPGDDLAQGRMKAQQAAGRIGKAPGDLIGLAAFGIAHGVRGALGATSPLASSLTSGIGGGSMAAVHSLLNLNTHTEANDGSVSAPTHHVTNGGFTSIRDVGDVVSRSFKSVAGNGPVRDQVANTFQDIFGARGIAALQGLLIANLVKAQIANSTAGSEPTVGQKFGQTTAATVALLGLSFFANLSLAARRGKTSEPMSGSIAALKSLDPSTIAEGGGMHALMEAKSTGAGARAWNAALKVVDGAARAGKTLETLPGHAVLDTLTLGKHAAGWMFSPVFSAGGVNPGISQEARDALTAAVRHYNANLPNGKVSLPEPGKRHIAHWDEKKHPWTILALDHKEYPYAVHTGQGNFQLLNAAQSVHVQERDGSYSWNASRESVAGRPGSSRGR